MRQSYPSSIASNVRNSVHVPNVSFARLTEILQLMSMPSIPAISDTPEELVLMTPDTVEVAGIAMVMEPMDSIVNK